jgi:murein DD-endopeptidase MepM/ murein hydrolase activator NlpD
MTPFQFIPKLKHVPSTALMIGLLGSTALVPQTAIALAKPDTAISPDPAPPLPPSAESTSEVIPQAPQPLQVESAEVFVDKTDYSLGATQPIDPETALSGGGRDNVQVQIESRQAPHLADLAETSREPQATQVSLGENFGSIQLSSAGIGWSPSQEAPSEQSVIPATASYLNRKLLRPFSRIGNQNLKLIFPLAIPAPITSLFGWRTHPISGSARMHTGTDIGAPMGTPVVAALAGRVLLSDFLGGYGLTIALEHSDGTQQTLYGHLSEIFVKPGELIQQGAVIGRVGSTGNSTGPHLHFELRQLTDAGWMAMDAGEQLESTMGDLVNALKVSSAPQKQAFNLEPLKAPTNEQTVTQPSNPSSTGQPTQPLILKPQSSPIPPFKPTAASPIGKPDRLKMVQ